MHCFGGELGMEEYIRARPDIFFTGPDGSMRSNRAFCQLAGQYAVICSLVQPCRWMVWLTPRPSPAAVFPASAARRTWATTHGRRHATPAWLNMITERTRCSAGKSWWCRWSKPSRPA